MAKAIATVGGVALAPGVSRNGRLYTREAIAGMVARVQSRIASGEAIPVAERDEPLAGHVVTQLTHHAAEDDSTKIVGRVTSMTLDESGRARFTADIAPTPAGRTIADLLDTSDGRPPFLRGVSGRMAWVDGARIKRMANGTQVETGDELDLLGLDYTHKPGVPDAAVDTFSWTGGGQQTETSERVLIYESVEAVVAPITEETIPADPAPATTSLPGLHTFADGLCVTCEATEAANKQPYGAVAYADPGYQADKKARYPVDTKAHAKAAWSYISQAANAKLYTAAQLKRVKGRIVKALKRFGVKTAAEGWVIDPARALTESEIAEYYGGDPSMSGSWSVSASNGPVNLNLSCYGMDPADLDVILRAAADAACKALAVLDPDMDGDIDVPGAGAEDTDGDAGESTADPAMADEADESPAPEAAAGETTERTDPMPESTPAAETTAAATFTQADVEAAVARGIAAADDARRARKAAKRAQAPESAPAAAVTESAPAAPAAAPAAPAAPAAVQESEDDRITRLVNERLAAEFPAETEDERIGRKVQEAYDAAVAQRVQSGQVTASRKGVVKGANETAGAVSESLNEHGLPASWPDKPLHKFSQEELDQYTGPVIVRHVLKDRADLLG